MWRFYLFKGYTLKDRRTGRAGAAPSDEAGGWLLLSLLVAEAALTVGLQAASALRRRLKGEPKEGFPRGEWPEIELESGDECLKLYAGYEGLYEAMLEEIGRAEDHVYIETFIFNDGEVGRRLVDALARKAFEGVRVHVLYDALASLSTSSGLFPEGVHALPYRPFSGPTNLLNPYNYVRTHRKILAVDGRVAFLGGFNFGVEYSTGWRDTHVRVRGEAVRDAEDAFADFWNRHRTGDLPEVSPPEGSVAGTPPSSCASTTLR